jgi:hypothetical protein
MTGDAGNTAKARILPARMLPIAPPSVVIQSEMRPEIMSVTAWLNDV